MKTTIYWVYNGHREAFLQALSQTHAVTQDDEIKPEYGAALYLLTGLKNAWPRLKPYVTLMVIDYEGMLSCESLNTEEQLIINLSQNLIYSGPYFNFTPINLVYLLNDEMWELVMNGLALRRGTVTWTMRDIADD